MTEIETLSTTLTTTQTVTYCEEENVCTNTVVTLTTCVPITHTVTVCDTVIDGKTVTVTVPCEIETEYVTAETTVVGTTEIVSQPVETIPVSQPVETAPPVVVESTPFNNISWTIQSTTAPATAPVPVETSPSPSRLF